MQSVHITTNVVSSNPAHALDITLCDKVNQWPTAGQWFSLVSSTNKTDRQDITEILLKVAFNTITLIVILFMSNINNFETIIA
jgi:hypothetical protein